MCCGYGYSRILLKVQEKSKHIVCKIFFYRTDKKNWNKSQYKCNDLCKIEKLSDTKEFYYLRQNPYDHQSIRLSTSDVDIRVFCVVKYQVKLKKT